jgi:hypothetical protein
MLRDIDRSAHILMKIGAADAAPGDLNLKLSRRRLGRVSHILHANVLPAVPDCGFHEHLVLRYKSFLPFVIPRRERDDQLALPATNAGCPIQAVLWLEWDKQHSTSLFCH